MIYVGKATIHAGASQLIQSYKATISQRLLLTVPKARQLIHFVTADVDIHVCWSELIIRKIAALIVRQELCKVSHSSCLVELEDTII